LLQRRLHELGRGPGELPEDEDDLVHVQQRQAPGQARKNDDDLAPAALAQQMQTSGQDGDHVHGSHFLYRPQHRVDMLSSLVKKVQDDLMLPDTALADDVSSAEGADQGDNAPRQHVQTPVLDGDDVRDRLRFYARRSDTFGSFPPHVQGDVMLFDSAREGPEDLVLFGAGPIA